MMGQQVVQGSLFQDFRLDDHVPGDHLAPRIDGLLDFGFVRDALADSYSAAGRPAIDPELTLRMTCRRYAAAAIHHLSRAGSAALNDVIVGQSRQ